MNRLEKIEADIAEIKRHLRLEPTQQYAKLTCFLGNFDRVPIVHKRPTRCLMSSLSSDIVVYHKEDLAPEVWFLHRPSGAFHFVCASVWYFVAEDTYHIQDDFPSDLVRDRFIETFWK